MIKLPPRVLWRKWPAAQISTERSVGARITLVYCELDVTVWLFAFGIGLTLLWRACEHCEDPDCNGVPCIYCDGDYEVVE